MWSYRYTAALSMVAFIAAAVFILTLRARTEYRSGDVLDDQECTVSECGPDGVPLSVYAG